MPADRSELSTCVSVLSSGSQVQSFLKLHKSLKHIICGFQWVWTSCLKCSTSKWFNSCTSIWIFSRHNEMGNYFRIYLISIAARHQNGADWHICAGKGSIWLPFFNPVAWLPSFPFRFNNFMNMPFYSCKHSVLMYFFSLFFCRAFSFSLINLIASVFYLPEILYISTEGTLSCISSTSHVLLFTL